MRALDVSAALAILALSAPLLLAIAGLIVAESGRPVFYRAPRVGRGGTALRMLKFRKMRRDASGPMLTADADERLTRVGRLLIGTRLDELPQLWHVLRGEMSLVGPRPEDGGFVARRPDDFATILTVRPGITGLSQLAYADERRILARQDPVADYVERVLPAKCRLDLLYIRKASLGLNLRILLWTLIAVVARRPVAVDRATAGLTRRRRPAAGALQEAVRCAP
jgi:lipopolysaccharide/colanic/teichoic acid biosynthesis glycosyltransferase